MHKSAHFSAEICDGVDDMCTVKKIMLTTMMMCAYTNVHKSAHFSAEICDGGDDMCTVKYFSNFCSAVIL